MTNSEIVSLFVFWFEYRPPWLIYPVFSASNQIAFDNRCEKQYDKNVKLAIGIGYVVFSIMNLHNEKFNKKIKRGYQSFFSFIFKIYPYIKLWNTGLKCKSFSWKCFHSTCKINLDTSTFLISFAYLKRNFTFQSDTQQKHLISEPSN